MRIKSLAQGENILMLGFEPSTFCIQNRHSNHYTNCSHCHYYYYYYLLDPHNRTAAPVKWVPGGDNLVKDVQYYELFGGIALKNHAFSFFIFPSSRFSCFHENLDPFSTICLNIIKRLYMSSMTVAGGDHSVKDVQCYVLFGVMAHKNDAFFSLSMQLLRQIRSDAPVGNHNKVRFCLPQLPQPNALDGLSRNQVGLALLVCRVVAARTIPYCVFNCLTPIPRFRQTVSSTLPILWSQYFRSGWWPLLSLVIETCSFFDNCKLSICGSLSLLFRRRCVVDARGQ